MEFKNIKVFTCNMGISSQGQQLEEFLDGNRFTPCQPSQSASIGFISPRTEDFAPLVEYASPSCFFIRVRLEDKIIPPAIIKQKLDEACEAFNDEYERYPGRNLRAEMREDIILELLPQAFPRQRDVYVMIDLKNRVAYFNTTSMQVIDRVITCIVRTVEKVTFSEFNTKTPPSVLMSEELQNKEITDWRVGDKFKLEDVGMSRGERKRSVTIKDIPNDDPWVQELIDEGMQPVMVEFDYAGMYSFELHHNGDIKNIWFNFETYEDMGIDAECDDLFNFEKQVASIGVRDLFNNLVTKLGGEYVDLL